MRRHLMKSNIHRATVTSADLRYDGSLTLDRTLMAAADLVEHEEIHVVNVNNGQRLTTYVIPGAVDSGVVQLNGEVATHRPAVVFVDGSNRIARPPLSMET